MIPRFNVLGMSKTNTELIVELAADNQGDLDRWIEPLNSWVNIQNPSTEIRSAP